MSAPSTITTLSGVQLDGTCKLTANQLKTSTNNTLTFPAAGGTLATTSDIPSAPDLSSCATLDGTEILRNKTLVSPIISYFKNGDYTIEAPNKTGTIALTSDINAGGEYPLAESYKSLGFNEVSSSNVSSGTIYLYPIRLTFNIRLIKFYCIVKFKNSVSAGSTVEIRSNSMDSTTYLPDFPFIGPFVNNSNQKPLGTVFIKQDSGRVKLIYTASEAIATTIETFVSGAYFAGSTWA